MNIFEVTSIHFVGIKGVAMTALAIIAKEMGMRVSGSDSEEQFPTDKTLKKYGITPKVGFSDLHIPPNTHLVVYTGAHGGAQNPEVQAAKLRGISVLPHGIALGKFMEGRRSISVAGSHGKTTTSGLIASVLMSVHKDPSFAIGCGEILNLKTSAHNGKGEWFVAEADEYVTDPQFDKTPRFLWQKPEVLVITNIDFDHPDVYENLEDVQKAFIQFANHMPQNGTVIANSDDLPTLEILPKIRRKIVTFGQSDKADFRLVHVAYHQGETEIEIHRGTEFLGKFRLKIPGNHNALNATAAVAALTQLGIQKDELVDALPEFSGTKRRFELIADIQDKLLYDDYAHHPTEIAATLQAARAWFPKRRIIVIFQAHTYSRTKRLLSEFSTCFKDADEVIITEIYASAREKPMTDVSGKVLWQAISREHNAVYFASGRANVVEYIRTNSHPQDLIITMGAGDVYSWVEDIKKAL